MAAKKKRERRRTMWWINGYDGDYRSRDMMANHDGHRIYLGFPTEAGAEAALDRWLRESPPLSETRAHSREPQPRAFMEKRYADGGGVTVASFVARRGGVDGGGSTVYQWEREAR